MRISKRICSAVMCLIMMLTMTTFVGVTSPAKAVTVDSDVIVVDAALTQANGTKKTVTIGGNNYDVVIGTNGFTTIAAAITAAEDGDTILLQAGTYTETPQITKNLTFLGPKAGIDPNVKGTTETADWTQSPQRGSGEAILKGMWYIGDTNLGMHNVTDFTIDGVTLSGNAQLRHNKSSADTARKVNLTVKNIVIKDHTCNTGVFYFATYAAIEHARRYVTLENIRAEKLVTYSMLEALGAERFTASGIYMGAQSTAAFTEVVFTADGKTYPTATSFTVTDSMFRGTNAFAGANYQGIINATYDKNVTISNIAQNANIDSKPLVRVSIKNNVFIDNDNGKTSNNCSVFLSSRSTKTEMEVIGNTFINNDTPTTGHSAIGITFGNADCFNSSAKFYRNRVINTMLEKGATGANHTLIFNGNYAENATGKVVAPVVNEADAHTLTWWYLDWDMTKSSAPVVINKAWTEGNTPTSYTFKEGEEDEQVISNLIYGVNAFSSIGTAVVYLRDHGGAGNVMILAPGTYNDSIYIPIDLQVKGAKAGIDPNVKGAKRTDDWTQNPNRGTGETILTGVWRVGISNATTAAVYAACDYFTMDGVTFSEGGYLRNNTGLKGQITAELRNIIVNNSTATVEPFYFHAAQSNSTGQYVRNLTFENIRFIGQTKARGIWADADYLYASGIYMDETSLYGLVNTFGTSQGNYTTAPVNWTFTDMNIRCKARAIMHLSARSSSQSTNNTIGLKERVDIAVTNSVFYHNQHEPLDLYYPTIHTDNIIVPQQNTPNVFFNFTGNHFIAASGMSFNSTAISSHTDKAGAFAANSVVQDNVFKGFATDVNYATVLSEGTLDISGNYSEGKDGKFRKPVGTEAAAKWWYVDQTLAHTSAELDGVLSADATGSVNAENKTATYTTAKDSITFTVKSNYGNTVAVYADKDLKDVLSTPTPLFEETQTYYVKVSSMDGTNAEVYTTTITTSTPNLLDLNLAKDARLFGRVRTEGDKYLFNWTASGFEFNFKGTGASADMIALDTTNNDTNDRGGKNAAYVKVYVDGKHTKTIELSNTKETYVLAEGLSNEEHTIQVVKRTNARASGAAVTRVSLAEGSTRLAPPKAHTRLIQSIGDSITVGYGSMGDSSTPEWDTSTEDGTITYAALAAQAFCADYDVLAISGRGILRNTGGTNELLIPEIYDMMDPYVDTSIKYDFARQPDVVVVNLGTNDAGSIGKEGYETKAQWVVKVKEFLTQLRETHPAAQIVYAYGLMTTALTTEIQQAINELGDDAIHFVALPTIGSGEKCLGHPNALGHQNGSIPLIAKIKEVTGWEEGHVAGEWTTVTPSTATTTGVKTTNCTVCHEEMTAVIPADSFAANGITIDDTSVQVSGSFDTGYTVKIPMGRPRIPQLSVASKTRATSDTEVTQAMLPDGANSATATIKLAGGEETTVTFVKDASEGFVLQYGDRYTFKPSINATKFTSSNTSVATVDNKGVITVKSVNANGVTITATAANGDTEKLVITKTIRAVLGIWMLTGQSNSEPSYFDLNTTVRPAAGTALYWGRKPNEDGSALSSTWTTTPEEMTNNNGTAKFGALDAPIAKTIYDYTGEKVLMFSVGWSGKSVSTFNPTTNSATSSSNPYGRSVIQWNSMMNVVNSAAFQANYETRVRSYFWLQGCADHGMAVATYKNHFTAMHDVYTDASGIFGFDNCFISKVSWRPRGLAYMSRQAQEELAAELDNVHIATRIGQTMSLAEGTYRTDNLHFNQAGKNLMGPQMGAFAARYYMGGTVQKPATGATVFAYQNAYNKGEALHVFPGQNFTFTLRPDPIDSDDQFDVKFKGDNILTFDGKDWMQISGTARDGQTANAEIYSENGDLLWTLPIVVVDNTQTASSDPTAYKQYRWDFNGNLDPTYGDITLSKVAGTDPVFTADGSMDNARGTYYKMSEDITLDHTGYWAIEWRAKDMTAQNNMILTSHEDYKGTGEFFYVYYRSELYWDIHHSTLQHNIYNTLGMDITDWHTYRIELIDNKYIFTIDGNVVYTQAVIDGHDVSGFPQGESKFSNFSNIHYILGGENAAVGNTATYGADVTIDYLTISVADDLRLTKVKDARREATGGSGTAADPFTLNISTFQGETFVGSDFGISGPKEVRMLMYEDTLFGTSVATATAPMTAGESKDLYLVLLGPDEVNSVYYKITMTAMKYDAAAWVDIVTAQISSGAPVKDGNVFSVLYNCMLNPNETLDFAATPITFYEYGMIYATSNENLEKYAASGKFGEEPTIAGTQRFIYDSSATGLNKIYKQYAFNIKNIQNDKTRCGMAFIQFEYDGVLYEVYSDIEDGSTLGGGIISGTGDTIVGDDGFND